MSEWCCVMAEVNEDLLEARQKEIKQLRAESERLRSVISDIYPTIAGHVIALEQAGETVAHERWAEVARKIYEALEVGK